MNPRSTSPALRVRARRRRARGAALGGVLLAGAALCAVPSAAGAATGAAVGPALAASSPAECRVVSSDLAWGVKERFRSYISGSIANGGWTTDNGATYETPEFLWTSADGGVAADLGTGELPFTGSIHFTGHDGLLRFDLRDPAIEIEDAKTAALTLSIGATDTGATGADAADDGEESAGGTAPEAHGELETTRVRAAEIELTGAVTAGGDRLVIDGAVPLLTAEGASAFNGEYGSYVAGEELDPIAVSATVAGCELDTVTAAPTVPDSSEGEGAQPPAEQGIPWIPIAVGAVALLVIGVAGGLLFATRRVRGTDGGQGADGDTADSGRSDSTDGPGT